jgi:hypothetical protein
MARTNVIIWRGTIFKTNSTRQILLNMTAEQSNDQVWLDAASSKEKDKTLKIEQISAFYRYQIDIVGQIGISWNGLRRKMWILFYPIKDLSSIKYHI